MRAQDRCGQSSLLAASERPAALRAGGIARGASLAGRFDAASLAPSPGFAFMPASAPKPRQEARRTTDWGALFAVAQAEKAASGPAPMTVVAREAAVVPMTSANWKLVTSVNSRVNKKIIYREDKEAFGQADYWTMPLEDGQRYGDCEDFALEKRRELVAAGIPASALTIALVVTPTGQNHAVLVVATDKGDYVLDNLTPWVDAWSATSYHWVARQLPGGGELDWTAIDAPRA